MNKREFADLSRLSFSHFANTYNNAKMSVL